MNNQYIQANVIENICEEIKDKMQNFFCEIEIIGFKGTKERVSVDSIFTNIKCVPYPNNVKDQPEDCLVKFQNYENNTLLLGQPGGGKSTLVKRLLFQSASEIQEKRIIPIYLELKNLFLYECGISSPFMQLLNDKSFMKYAKYFYNKLRDGIGDSFIDYLNNENQIEEYKYVVFCDGLDEISADDYNTFNSFVNSIVSDPTQNKRVTFFISSRYQGFKTTDYKSSFKKFSLINLAIEQIDDYIDKYFKAFDGEDEKRDMLKKSINDRMDFFYDMANNPFLLSLMCVVNDITKIKDRSELFEEAINKLLTEHGKIEDDSIDELLCFLEEIAVSFFKQDKLENFEEGELKFYANKMQQNHLKTNFLHCGLFDESTDKKGYKFYHRTIWEYLVAKGMMNRPEDEIYERAEMKAWSVPIKMWVIMFCRENGENPNKIEGMFEELWKHNKALTLECLSEYEKCDDVLTLLYTPMDKRQKLRLIGALRESYINAPDYKAQAVEMIDKALRLIHQKEKETSKDCEIIYQYVELLEEFDYEPRFSKLLSDILDYQTLNSRLELLASKGLRFVDVNPGTFEMGRDKFTIPDDRDLKEFISIDDEEVPKHKVRITEQFQITQTLITNEMFYKCGFPFAPEKHGFDEDTKQYRNAYSPTDFHPVNFITWYEAIVFAKWLKCTLPTEAEWEYACLSCGEEDPLLNVQEQQKMREYLAGSNEHNPIAGEMRAHYSYAGNTTLPRVIFKDNNRQIAKNDIRQNKLGLVDMLGNLREWCLDWFSEDFYKKCDVSHYPDFSKDICGNESVSYYYAKGETTPRLLVDETVNEDVYTFDKEGYCIDPVKKYVDVAENKCIRGGCFDWNVTNLRPSYRNHNPATNIYKVNGFRIARKFDKGD